MFDKLSKIDSYIVADMRGGDMIVVDELFDDKRASRDVIPSVDNEATNASNASNESNAVDAIKTCKVRDTADASFVCEVVNTVVDTVVETVVDLEHVEKRKHSEHSERNVRSERREQRERSKQRDRFDRFTTTQLSSSFIRQSTVNERTNHLNNQSWERIINWLFNILTTTLIIEMLCMGVEAVLIVENTDDEEQFFRHLYLFGVYIAIWILNVAVMLYAYWHM